MVQQSLFADVQQDDVCNIYSEWKSQSQFFIAGYEGIPQNLIINFICAVGVVLGFSIGRRLLWNYGRLALLTRDSSKWKEEYNAEGYTDEGHEDDIVLNVDKQEYMSTSKGPDPDSNESQSQSRNYDDDLGDTGLFGWIRITLTMSDDYIYAKCGPDAVLYLRYQRHLVFLSSAITLCSLVVILPIHIMGDQLRDGRYYNPDSFAQSTVSNIASDSPYLWIHTIMAFTFYVMSVIVMRHFSRSFQANQKEDDIVHRTVMILGIDRRRCHAEKILAHVKQIYPKCVVEECTFAYDTSSLFNLETYKTSYINTLKHLQDLYERTMRSRKLRPYPRAIMPCVPWLWLSNENQVDAVRFYSDLIRKYKKLADYERARTLGRPLGICFITFQSALTAERMIHEYSTWRRFCDFLASIWGPFILDRTPHSRYSRKMRSKEWFLYRAPAVDDIQWEKYGLSLLPWFLKSIMVNFTVVLLALFFSTPIILIKTINYYVTIREQKQGLLKPEESRVSFSNIFYELLPTLLIWVAAVTLPSLVSVSDRIIGFWTKTAENRSRMIKTFAFLVTMVVILPSLGLSSILYMVGANRLKWECIYSPSNAAFYMNYVITSCFLGTTAELWRFSELFYIICLHLFKKSSYENPSLRIDSLFEFPIGSQYAWMMLVFSVFVVFSLICPLISPLGVLYMLIKHFVDKYNIYFAYARCSVDNSVHSTAINFVTFCMFLLLTITFVLTNIAWSEDSYNPGLQAIASELYILALLILVAGKFADLQGTTGTVVYRKKDATHSENDNARRNTYSFRRKPTFFRNGKEKDNEDIFYKSIPRTAIDPENRYFAPMLRKEFPFAPPLESNKFVGSKLEEILLHAELSLQHQPNFKHLIASLEKSAPPKPIKHSLVERKIRFDANASKTPKNTKGSKPRKGKSWADILRGGNSLNLKK